MSGVKMWLCEGQERVMRLPPFLASVRWVMVAGQNDPRALVLAQYHVAGGDIWLDLSPQCKLAVGEDLLECGDALAARMVNEMPDWERWSHVSSVVARGARQVLKSDRGRLAIGGMLLGEAPALVDKSLQMTLVSRGGGSAPLSVCVPLVGGTTVSVDLSTAKALKAECGMGLQPAHDDAGAMALFDLMR